MHVEATTSFEQPATLHAALERKPLIVTRDFALLLSAGWRRLVEGRGSRYSTNLQWLPLIVVPFVPVVLDLCLRLVDAGSSWRGLAWMSMSALLTSALLVTAPWAWDRVKETAEPIELMFTGATRTPQSEHPELQAEYTQYVDEVARRLSLGNWHYVFCGIGSVVGLAGSYFASKHLPDGTFGPGYYIGIAVLAFFGADSIRWMLRVPLIMVQPLTRYPRLIVVMHSPATTPAIREMGQVSAETAVRAGVGFFLFGLTLLWAVLSGNAYRGHGISHVEQLALVSLAPLIVSAAVVIYVSFIPQAWLSQIVVTQRDRILDELAAELPEEGAANLLSDETNKVMALYDRIAGVTTETAEARTIGRRTIAVVAVLLPQLLAVGSKLLHIQ